MKRFFIQIGGLLAAICIVYSCIIYSIEADLTAQEEVQERHVTTTKPVIVPYLDIDINDVMRGEKVYVRNQKAVEKDESLSTDTDGFIGEAIVNAGTDDYDDGESARSESDIPGDTSSVDSGYSEDSTDVGDTVKVHQEFTAVSDGYESSGSGEPMPELVESGTDDDVSETGAENYSTGDDGEFDSIQTVSESGLTYLGDWTITAYCPCESCCGAYSSGYTASGTLATAGRTIACNILPIGTQVMIDDCIYTVEDTGWSPYEQWIDIFFDTHEEALAYGVQVREVYLVE